MESQLSKQVRPVFGDLCQSAASDSSTLLAYQNRCLASMPLSTSSSFPYLSGMFPGNLPGLPNCSYRSPNITGANMRHFWPPTSPPGGGFGRYPASNSFFPVFGSSSSEGAFLTPGLVSRLGSNSHILPYIDHKEHSFLSQGINLAHSLSPVNYGAPHMVPPFEKHAMFSNHMTSGSKDLEELDKSKLVKSHYEHVAMNDIFQHHPTQSKVCDNHSEELSSFFSYKCYDAVKSRTDLCDVSGNCSVPRRKEIDNSQHHLMSPPIEMSKPSCKSSKKPSASYNPIYESSNRCSQCMKDVGIATKLNARDSGEPITSLESQFTGIKDPLYSPAKKSEDTSKPFECAPDEKALIMPSSKSVSPKHHSVSPKAVDEILCNTHPSPAVNIHCETSTKPQVLQPPVSSSVSKTLNKNMFTSCKVKDIIKDGPKPIVVEEKLKPMKPAAENESSKSQYKLGSIQQVPADRGYGLECTQSQLPSESVSQEKRNCSRAAVHPFNSKENHTQAINLTVSKTQTGSGDLHKEITSSTGIVGICHPNPIPMSKIKPVPATPSINNVSTSLANQQSELDSELQPAPLCLGPSRNGVTLSPVKSNSTGIRSPKTERPASKRGKCGELDKVSYQGRNTLATLAPKINFKERSTSHIVSSSSTSIVLPASVNSCIPVGIAIAQQRQDSSTLATSVKSQSSSVGGTNNNSSLLSSSFVHKEVQSQEILREQKTQESSLSTNPTPVETNLLINPAPILPRQWESEAFSGSSPWIGSIVAPTLWLGQGMYTVPAPNSVPLEPSLPPGGYQLARDSLTGHLLLIPTASIGNLPIHQLTTQQQTQFDQVIPQGEALKIPEAFDNSGTVPGNTVLESDKKIDDGSRSIPVASGQAYAYTTFPSHCDPASFSYVLQSSTVMHLEHSASVQAEPGRQSQATSPLPCATAPENASDEDEPENTDTQVQTLSVSQSVTTAVQVDLDSLSTSEDEEEKKGPAERTLSTEVKMSDSANQTESVLSESANFVETESVVDVQEENSFKDSDASLLKEKEVVNQSSTVDESSLQEKELLIQSSTGDESSLQEKELLIQSSTVDESSLQEKELLNQSSTGDESSLQEKELLIQSSGDESSLQEKELLNQSSTGDESSLQEKELLIQSSTSDESSLQEKELLNQSSTAKCSAPTGIQVENFFKDVDALSLSRQDTVSNSANSSAPIAILVPSDLKEDVVISTDEGLEIVTTEQLAPSLPVESKPVMDFIDHHGLDLLVDSIEEFASGKHSETNQVTEVAEPVATEPEDKTHTTETTMQTLKSDDHSSSLLKTFESSCTDGLGLLCALAEQRFLEEASSERKLTQVPKSDSQQTLSGGSSSQSSMSSSPGHHEATEIDMQLQIKELQQKYKEKQEELELLKSQREKVEEIIEAPTPKKDINDFVSELSSPESSSLEFSEFKMKKLSSVSSSSSEEKSVKKRKTKAPLFDEQAWYIRRSERIFLSDARTSVSNAAQPVGEKNCPKSPKHSCKGPKKEKSKVSRKLSMHQESDDSEAENSDAASSTSENMPLSALVDSSLPKGLLSSRPKRVSTDSELSSGQSEDFPLSALLEHKAPELPSCILKPENLQENVRLLVLDEGLFYAGHVSNCDDPNLFGILIDGDRAARPHMFSREEILNAAVLEVKPTHRMQLKEGLRICAFWSQQYRCLYPGTIAKASSPPADSMLINVEFDDGDSGRIPLSDIRMLPQDFPIVLMEPNPYMILGKRRTRSLSQNSSGPGNSDEGAKCKKRKNPNKFSHGALDVKNNDTTSSCWNKVQDTVCDPSLENAEHADTSNLPLKAKKHKKHKDDRNKHHHHHHHHHKHHHKKHKTEKQENLSAISQKNVNLNETNGKSISASMEQEHNSFVVCNPKSDLTVTIKKSPIRENDDEPHSLDKKRQNDAQSTEDTDLSVKKVKKCKMPDSPDKGGKLTDHFPSCEKSKIAAFLPIRQLWSWYGKSYKRPGARGKAKKEFYRAIQRGKELIRVGDTAVFLSTGRPHLPYIGRIETMWESWGGKMDVKVKWFYHPEETKIGKKFSHLKGALFQSPHFDENDVQTISHKCQVLSWVEYQRISSSTEDNNGVYFLAGTYDPFLGTLTLEPGVPNIESCCVSDP